MASGFSLQTTAGTVYFSVDDSGNVTATGNLAVTGTVTAASWALTAPYDFSAAFTGTDELINADATINHATQVGVGVDATIAQLSTARTGGYAAALRAKTTSLAGDLNGVSYAGLHVLAPTDGGGAVLHSGLYVAGGNDYSVHGLDSVLTAWGTGAAGVADATMGWDGTILALLPAVDDSPYKLGNGTLSWDVWIYGNTAADYVLWDASASTLSLQGAAVFGAVAFAGTTTLADGSILQRTGAGTGTGDVIEVLGPDATHGMKTVVYEATVSPIAIETALFTLPANSVIDHVQANVQAALTGGGTTVTFGIGITGDVDKFGTAFSAGAQADLLTQNAKINAIGSPASPPQPGTGIGEYQPAAISVKLIGAATGGATAGNTALTVGSVKVRVVYRTLMDMANA